MAKPKADVRPKKAAPAGKGQPAPKQAGRKKAQEEHPLKLTPQQERFCQEYVTDLNGTQSAIRAGYSTRTANEQAGRLLSHVSVRSRIDELKAERATRTQITADRVLTEAWNIATADPRELVEYRVGACRYCFGKEHRYHRTASEFERAEAEHAVKEQKAIEDGKPHPGEFDPQGGVGYNKLADPNPECPECFGEGIGRTVFKDTSKVSPAVASLFAGVKETKDGLEIKLHSKDGALEKMFKHMGLYEADNRQKNPMEALNSLATAELLKLRDKLAGDVK